MSKKPPAKKPAKMTTRDGKPVKFPKTWGRLARNTGPFPDAIMPVTTSSRTQAPKKPIKPTRVKRPKDCLGWCVFKGKYGWAIYRANWIACTPSEARRLAAWLAHAAAYIEQEAKRG